MKNIIILSILMFSTFTKAQVLIGTDNIDGESIIMDFNNETNNTKGIILPSVDKLPEYNNKSSNNGTFLYNKDSQNIMMYENNSWRYLSEYGSNKLLASDDAEEIGSGIIVGSETSEAEGVLILESNDKAIVLPKITDPHKNVNGPYPGMICYDIKSKSFAIFDGEYWNYWK